MKSVLPGVPTLLLIAACGRSDDDDNPEQALDLSTQLHADFNAQPIGQTGVLEDYKQEVWEPWVRELFVPLDTEVLPQSDITSDSLSYIHFYPNPAQQMQSLAWRPGDTVNVKVVMVTRLRRPVHRISKSFTWDYKYAGLYFNYDQMNLPASDNLYRMYFAFSTQARPYFYTSHADVTVRR